MRINSNVCTKNRRLNVKKFRRFKRANGRRANRGDIIEKEWLLVRAYRVSWHGHLYICRRATRGRSAVGDMFTGHDLLPTSATVNLGVTTSASATEAQGRQPHTEAHREIFSKILGVAYGSFFFSAFNVKLSRLCSFQLDTDFFKSTSLRPIFPSDCLCRLIPMKRSEVVTGFFSSFFRRIRSYHLKNRTAFVRKRIVSFRLTNVTDLTKLRGKLQVQLPVLAETIEGHNPVLSELNCNQRWLTSEINNLHSNLRSFKLICKTYNLVKNWNFTSENFGFSNLRNPFEAPDTSSAPRSNDRVALIVDWL